MNSFLLDAFIYFCAAVVAVPLAKRLGLGSVLGYLIAGVMIGPVLGLVGKEAATLQGFAEFGIVMMLFIIGLELEPKMLWGMRNKLLGLGGLQMVLTTGIVAAAGLAFGLDWRIALTIGMVMSLSSTTIVLQSFEEMGVSRTAGGRSAFSALLFQDIAVIPMLALIPLLAIPELVAQSAESPVDGAAEEFSLVAGLDGWSYAMVVLAAIGFVIVLGHYLSRPLFRFIASTGLREAFTAAALTLVIGIAALMTLVGLSPALGTFLAGVVLATSEFRYELETDIEPFKGLLLGLFFITVGAGIQFDLLADNLVTVLLLTAGVMLLKALVLFFLAFVFGVRGSDGWLFTLSLTQVSAFGFVLLGYCVQHNVLPAELVPVLALVVALSMFLTPLLFILFQTVIMPRYRDGPSEREADTIEEQGPVIIAGSGRFGQIVNRLLRSNGYPTVVLDREPRQIEMNRYFNLKSFYGDATRADLLLAAGVEDAALFVIAIDDVEQSVELVRLLRKRYPSLRILARAHDRGHFYRLFEAGANDAVIETYHSALSLGTSALRELGVHPFKANQYRYTFDAAERRARKQLYQRWVGREEGERWSSDYQKLFIELEETLSTIMRRDRDDGHTRSERGWSPPPKPSDD